VIRNFIVSRFVIVVPLSIVHHIGALNSAQAVDVDVPVGLCCILLTAFNI